MESVRIFNRPLRMSVSLSFEVPDKTIVTEPGMSQSVQKLYQDFVLGRLDPSQIGNNPVYDSPDGMITEGVDPFNSFGMTLEEADALRQTSESEVRKAKKKQPESVANAQPSATPTEAKPGEGKREDEERTK